MYVPCHLVGQILLPCEVHSSIPGALQTYFFAILGMLNNMIMHNSWKVNLFSEISRLVFVSIALVSSK